MSPNVRKSGWTFPASGALLCAVTVGCAWMPSFVRTSATESNRLLEEARQASAAGDRGRAKQLLAQAAEVAPDEPEIQRGIGKAMLLSGDAQDGLKHIHYAVRHGVDDPDAYVDLAQVLMDAGRLKECREMIDAALKLVPAHVPAQLLNGRLAELDHKDEDALEIYYRLLANDPSDSEAALRVADVLVRLERFSQAAPLLRSVVDSDRIPPPEQARAHWMLGLIYGRDRRWLAAATELSAGAALRPKLSADECYQVAYAFWEAGDREKAGNYVSLTLSIDPRYPEAQALAAAFRSDDSSSRTAYSRMPLPAPKSWQ